MAISAASLTSGTDNATTTSFATASVSPTSGRMVYVGVGTIQTSGAEASAAAPSGLSGNGLTWTKVHEEVSTVTGVASSVWRAKADSPSSGAITITFAANKAFAAWSVIEVDGADTSGTNGANSVVQSAGAQADSGSATSAPVTLSTFADAGNGAVGFFFHVGIGSTPTATADTGWTELNEATNFEGAGYGSQSQWRSDNDTTVGPSWSVGGYSRGIALEIKAAGAPAATLTQARFRWRNDDGSETTATWAAAEDTPISLAKNTPVRLRVEIGATGDPASAAYKLQYRKVGDSTWRDIN